MEKQEFIDILSQMSPQEINDYIQTKGKTKLSMPFMFVKGGKLNGNSKKLTKGN